MKFKKLTELKEELDRMGFIIYTDYVYLGDGKERVKVGTEYADFIFTHQQAAAFCNIIREIKETAHDCSHNRSCT